jgi:SAM-dependent methyltransferase
MAGDFAQIARAYEAGAEEFVARLGLGPGMRVLDVACGTGNQSIPAARTGASVTGCDIAPNLLEQAKAEARKQGLAVQFDEADAEALPYETGAFDVALSMFGAMFAPQPERVAVELLRVVKPGGRVVMANWTPSCFIGRMFKTTASHVPPPAGMPSPVLWGDEAKVRERFGEGVSHLQLTPRIIAFDLPCDPAETVEFFRRYYGPTQRAFESLDAERQAALRRDLVALWAGENRAPGGATHVESEYLEVVATRG